MIHNWDPRRTIASAVAVEVPFKLAPVVSNLFVGEISGGLSPSTVSEVVVGGIAVVVAVTASSANKWCTPPTEQRSTPAHTPAHTTMQLRTHTTMQLRTRLLAVPSCTSADISCFRDGQHCCEKQWRRCEFS
eukprot:gene9855-2046_t